MFALIAAFIIFLAAFGVGLSDINMLYLALGFLFIHFGWSWTPWSGYVSRRNP